MIYCNSLASSLRNKEPFLSAKARGVDLLVLALLVLAEAVGQREHNAAQVLIYMHN